MKGEVSDLEFEHSVAGFVTLPAVLAMHHLVDIKRMEERLCRRAPHKVSNGQNAVLYVQPETSVLMLLI